jgi:competence protein ComEC
MVWTYSLALTAGVSGWVAIAAVFPAALAVASFIPAGKRRRWFAATLSLCAACYACGFLSNERFQRDHRRLRNHVAIHGGSTVLEGEVTGHPEHRPGVLRFPFATTLDHRPVTLLVSTRAFGIGYGDSLQLTGTVSAGRVDRRRYLQGRGACGYLRARPEDVVRLSNPVAPAALPGRLAWRVHDAIRRRLVRRLGSRSGLPLALSIGERGWVPRKVEASFSHLGITHLLALSGMHLGMIAAVLVVMLRWGGRHDRWAVLPVLGAYVFVVGNVVSLYRAYALAVVLVVASRTERPADPVRALGVALFVLLAARPGLVHSVAFQLSFTATLAVLIAAKRLRRRSGGGGWRRAAGAVVSVLCVGFCAQICLLPLQARYFGAVAPLTPLATLLFVLPVAAVMALTGLSLAVDVFLPPVSGVLFAALGALSGALEQAVVEVASWLPGPIELPAPNLMLYYAALGLCVEIFDAVFRRRVL